MVRESLTRWKCALIGAAVLALPLSVVQADSMVYTSFARITGNSAPLAQFELTVSDEGVDAGQIGLLFKNLAGGDPSDIANIYFEDGTLVFPDAGLAPGPGVDFVQNGSPEDPPGIDPWEGTQEFRISLDQNTADAIQPGEHLRVIFDLQGTYAFSDVIAAIANGFKKGTTEFNENAPSLRIAFHVRGLGAGGRESDSYLLEDPQIIPLPAPFGLALAGLFGVVIISRRKRKASASID